MELRDKGFINVGDGHRVFYQSYGRENDCPLLYLHGGPGSGFDPGLLPFFDNLPINLITFDQRGSGRSLPKGIDRYNTTPFLIQDIETVRKFFDIKAWHIAGHSWGTTLALLYALEYPNKCKGLVLASLLLARQKDLDWSFRSARAFFPDVFEKVRQGLSAAAPLESLLYAMIVHGSPADKLDAAYRVSYLGTMLTCMFPKPPQAADTTLDDIDRAALLLHYVIKKFFIPENTILQNATRLKSIPIDLLHGRFDMTCLVDQAVELKKACRISASLFAREGTACPKPRWVKPLKCCWSAVFDERSYRPKRGTNI